MVEAVGGAPQTRRRTKAPGAFRTISEVATDLEVPQHVLRFWESKFTQVKPLKRGGGRRYYRPEDVDLLRGIRHLLYSDGYTIKGVQKLLREIGSKTIMESGRSLSGNGAGGTGGSGAASGAAGAAGTGGLIGAAGVAAARTRRQGGASDPQGELLPQHGRDGAVAGDGSGNAGNATGSSAGDLPLGRAGAAGSVDGGLSAAQRGKLSELATELGELRDLLRSPGKKD